MDIIIITDIECIIYFKFRKDWSNSFEGDDTNKWRRSEG